MSRKLKDDGDALYKFLKTRMDIDTYLRYLALNGLMMNGDYADEVYFYAKAGKVGQPIYFNVMAWDMESLFRKPHWFPQNTVFYKHRIRDTLFYNMESRLDRRMSRDDYIQVKMANITKELLLKTFTPAFIEAKFASTKERLLPIADIARVMAPTAYDSGRQGPYTKVEIHKQLETKKSLILARRLELLKKADQIIAEFK